MATVNMSDSKQHTDSRSEVLLLTDEALKLARTACHFDKNKNYIGACDYYDRCLLNIDEVLNKLQPNSEQWKDLLRIRSQYDDRMEQLREYESIRLNINSSMISVKPDSKSLSTTSRKKRHKFDDETKFSDIQELSQLLSDPPVDAYEVPYWQLKNVRNTILTGGFLTKTIFIPKKVWYQSDVKFSGLTAKSTAFSIINNVISLNIDTLYLSCDEASLDFALSSLLSTEEEFFQLQNQLSKPFPYIKEIHSNHRNSSSGGVSTSNSVNNMAELQDSQSNSPANLPATAGGKSMVGVIFILLQEVSINS